MKPSNSASVLLSTLGAPRSNKYGAEATIVDGTRLDSKAEAERFKTLRLCVRAKTISRLAVHPVYDLRVAEVLIARYEADFAYLDHETGLVVVEDVKGVRTAAYRMKRKLMLACHGIEVVEIQV